MNENVEEHFVDEAAEEQPDVGCAEYSIGCVANLFSKQMFFPKAGDTERGHAHVFDHLTLLAKGSLRVTVDGKTSDFTAPQMIYIKAGKIHELQALTDETVAYCIHALRDGDGVNDIIDPSMIPDGVVPEYKPLIYPNNLEASCVSK